MTGRSTAAILLAATLAISLAVGGCGRKGDLEPPPPRPAAEPA